MNRTALLTLVILALAVPQAFAAVDLYQDQAKLDAIRKEWTQKTSGVTYNGLVPDGPPPIVKR